MNAFYKKGRTDALQDIEGNKLKIKVLGRMVSWFEEWREVLSNEYGVEFERYAGCMVSDEDSDYAKGYNEVSEIEIKRRFGNNVLHKTNADAVSIWESNS